MNKKNISVGFASGYKNVPVTDTQGFRVPSLIIGGDNYSNLFQNFNLPGRCGDYTTPVIAAKPRRLIVPDDDLDPSAPALWPTFPLFLEGYFPVQNYYNFTHVSSGNNFDCVGLSWSETSPARSLSQVWRHISRTPVICENIEIEIRYIQQFTNALLEEVGFIFVGEMGEDVWSPISNFDTINMRHYIDANHVNVLGGDPAAYLAASNYMNNIRIKIPFNKVLSHRSFVAIECPYTDNKSFRGTVKFQLK